MNKKNLLTLLSVAIFSTFALYAPSSALALYLNQDNMDVSLGGSNTEPFASLPAAQSLINAIDAEAPNSPELFTPFSQVWVNDGNLELNFDLKNTYSLTALHFWNYPTNPRSNFGESFDVDAITLSFLDENGVEVGSESFQPQLGLSGAAPNAVYAEVFDLAGIEASSISALISGTNNQLAFLNIGFTAVPLPASIWLLIAGLVSMGTFKKRAAK